MKKLLLFLFVLSSCTTVEFVRKETTPHKQGVLRFSPPSSESKEAEYKAEAANKAREFCGGDFTITKEYQTLDQSRSTAGVGTGFGLGGGFGMVLGGSGPSQTMYNFIEFSCK
jgi:hypothetical protein